MRDARANVVAPLVPALRAALDEMRAGAAFGSTLPRAQAAALAEFAAAVRAISEGLAPGAAPPLEAPPALSGSGGAANGASGGAARPLFPAGCGCTPGSPEAFYRVREALAAACKAAAAAFKGSHPALAKALRGAVEGLEDAGLFD